MWNWCMSGILNTYPRKSAVIMKRNKETEEGKQKKINMDCKVGMK